ncbi:hypothetical protein BDW60DRAFT_181815, partial [Aspergillus nidulans var. acristatus]
MKWKRKKLEEKGNIGGTYTINDSSLSPIHVRMPSFKEPIKISTAGSDPKSFQEVFQMLFLLKH